MQTMITFFLGSLFGALMLALEISNYSAYATIFIFVVGVMVGSIGYDIDKRKA